MSTLRHKTVVRGLASAGVRTIERILLPRGVVTDAIRLTLSASAGDIDVVATLSFRAHAATGGRMLALSQVTCPFELVAYSATTPLYLPRPDRHRSPRTAIRAMATIAGHDWHGASLTLRYRWCPRTAYNRSYHPGCLVAPLNVPAPVWEDYLSVPPQGLVQARVTLQNDAQETLLVSGLGARQHDVDTPLLQAMVARHEFLDTATLGHDIVCSATFSHGISRADVESICAFVRGVLECFNQEAGVAPYDRILLLTPDDLCGQRAWPWGIALTATPSTFGFGPAPRRSDLSIASQCAGIWWGGGCKLVGPGAKATEDGIRGAMAMLWAARSNDTIRITTLVEYYTYHAQRSRLAGWRDRIKGYPAPGTAARVALAVYSQITTMPGLLESVTSKWWGQRVSADSVLTDFGIEASGMRILQE